MSAITAKASRKMKKYAVLTREPRCFLGSFDLSWEQRKFSELVQIERGGSPRPIDDFITDAPNGLNWVKIGDAPTQGNYITKTAEKIRPEGLSKTREVHPGDLILSNSMSFGKPYIMGIDGCIHDGWLLIRNTYGVFDLTFLCHLLGTPQMLSQYRSLAAGSTVNNLNKELVGNTYVTIPSITEQRVLGAYLEQLDNLITLHQRKCALLFSPFQSFISMMFTTSTFSWEQRKLSHFLEVSSEKNTDNLYTKDDVLSVSGDFGVVNQIEFQGRSFAGASVSNYGVVHTGDVVYTKSPLKANPYGIIKANKGKTGIVSVLYGVYHTRENANADFVQMYFEQEARLNNYLRPLVNKGAKNTLLISDTDALEGEVCLAPTFDEQKVIGQFFDSLDNLITLHQRKCIFFTGRAGRLISTVNKKRITSSWEQRKLGELVDVCSGRDYKHLSEGTIPVYGTGGYMLSVNDALSYDRDAIGIGRKGTIDRPYILKAPFWTVDTLFYAIPREKVDLNYAFDIFQNIDWKKKDESTGVPSLSKTAINDIDVLAPKHDEQQIIGQFFAAIDNLITLHQRKPFLMKWRTSDANRNQTNRLVL